MIYANYVHVYGLGDSSVIQVDTTVPHTVEYAFRVLGRYVTVESMRLVGTGYLNPAGYGGIGVDFAGAHDGVARNLTMEHWGTVGIRSFDSFRTVIDSNDITADSGMGIWVSASDTSGSQEDSDVEVRFNHIRYARAEGIIVEARSGVTIDSNTIDSCGYGIVLRGVPNGQQSQGWHADSNQVLGNVVHRAGYFGAHTGFGILLWYNASYNNIIGNRIEDTNEEHNIDVAYSPTYGSQVGNRIVGNVTTYSSSVSNSNAANIWNGGVGTVIDSNTVSNAPNGIIISSSASAYVRHNILTNNTAHVSNEGEIYHPFCGNSYGGVLSPSCASNAIQASVSGPSEVPPGMSCNFYAAGSGGTEPYFYQWYVDGVLRETDGNELSWSSSSYYSITLVVWDLYEGMGATSLGVTPNANLTSCLDQRGEGGARATPPPGRTNR